MTAITVANDIVDEIETGNFYGNPPMTPLTSWCSWENDFYRFVIVIHHRLSSQVISRDDFDDMVSVFDARLGVRLSYIQGLGILVVETFFSITGARDTPAEIYRNDQSNSVIDR